MPSTVNDLLQAARLSWKGAVPWSTKVPVDAPGVYVVAMDESPDYRASHTDCPISRAAVQDLLDRRPELLLDSSRPTNDELTSRLALMWLSDESVLYVGLAGTSLAKRANQYYRTPLGARAPHAGGWPLKTLSILDNLWVHYAACDTVADAELAMATAFTVNVSDVSRAALYDPLRPLPFANLMVPKGPRKLHGITGAKEAL